VIDDITADNWGQIHLMATANLAPFHSWSGLEKADGQVLTEGEMIKTVCCISHSTVDTPSCYNWHVQCIEE